MTAVGHILGDPVTSHMRDDPTRIPLGQTVAEALEYVRKSPTSGRVVYFYVVGADGRLEGVLPTRRLLMADPAARVDELMVRSPITIPHTATVLDACEFFMLHKLLAFPVVDGDGRLVGLVDVDLYTEEMSDIEKREGNDELFQLIGVHLTEAQQASPVRAFRQRFPWLLANVAGGIVAAFLSGLFEAQLQKVVALALFIPVVLALAESVAIQSVTLALDALRGLVPSWADLRRRLRYEAVTGLLLGAAAGLLVAGLAAAWKGVPELFWIVTGGIGIGVTAAAVSGVAVPYLLHLFRRDPQVAAGPIALACADMLTLLAYFNLARALT
jgi:magnesium transporter